LGGASPGCAGCFKKATQIPNAGHPISPNKFYYFSKRQIHFRDGKSVQVTIKKIDFGSAIFFASIKVHMGVIFLLKEKNCHRKSTVKSCEFGRKVFFLSNCANFFHI
jgi:hypothetical protein